MKAIIVGVSVIAVAILSAQIMQQGLFVGTASGVFGGYGFHKTITIDHTQVGSSNSTDFPVVVSGTYAYLATVANSGNVTSSSGFDVVFTSDSGCSSMLNFERVTYTAASGLVQFWVKIPTVSHTVDTVFYECYGNSSITTDQSNATGTWTANFKGVYHLEAYAASGIPDSTGSNNSLTCGTTGVTPSTATGQIGNGIMGNSVAGVNQGADPLCISLGSMSNLYNGSNTVITTSFWVNVVNVASLSNDSALGEKSSGAGPRYYTYIGNDSASNKIDQTYCTTNACSSFIQSRPTASPTLANSTWYYVSEVLDLTTQSNSNVYLNGAVQTQVLNTGGTPPTTFNAPFDVITLLRLETNVLNGTLDEVHYANVNHSADWITAEYNNQKTGSTFLTIT